MGKISRALIGVLLLTFGASASLADAGFKPNKISRASRLNQDEGVVVISIRSEIYLPDKLEVFFLREGGNVDNRREVASFSRNQSVLKVTNDTTDFKPKSFRLAPGRYSLVAHGINCPGVPEPGQSCSVRIGVAGRGIARPSRGYAGETPSFEVVAGQITYAGDFALIGSDYIRWTPIPAEELAEAREDFDSLPVGPEPLVPETFVLDRPLNARGFMDNLRRN